MDIQPFTRRIDQLAFWFVVLNTMTASLLLVYHPDLLAYLHGEDRYSENAGAFFLLLTGVLLLLSAFHLRRRGKEDTEFVWWQFLMVLLAGIVFIIGFGEEISWGQRIFQVQTPEAIKEVNRQNEMNLHNFDTRIFNNAVETTVLLMILIPTIWMHRGKGRCLGFPIPSYWIILSLQMSAAYVTYSYVKVQDCLVYLILLYFIYIHARSKNRVKLFYVGCAAAVIIIEGLVNYTFEHNFHTNGPREIREYLLSFIFLAFAFTIYIDSKYRRRNGVAEA